MSSGQEDPSQGQRNQRSTPARYAVHAAKLSLAALVTWFVLRSAGVQLDEIRAIEWTSVQVDVVLLLSSFAVLFGELAIIGWLWSIVVKRLGGPHVPTPTAAAVLVLANFGRYVPGKVLQIVGVAVLAEKARCPAPVAVAASLFVQLMHVLGAAIVGGWAVLHLSGVSPQHAAAAGVALLLVLVGLSRRGRAQAALAWLLRRLDRGRRSQVDLDFRSMAGLAPLPWVAVFVAKWFVYGFAFFLLARSFGADGSFLFHSTVFAGAYLAGYVAVFAPAGVGVREAALVTMLEPVLGLGPSIVLAVAQRAWATAFELIGAPGSVAVLWWRRRSTPT